MNSVLVFWLQMTVTHRQTDASDPIICLMLSHSNEIDKKNYRDSSLPLHFDR